MTSPLKIIFAGTPDFAVPALEALLHSEHHVCCVYSQPDRPAGRGRKLTASPVKQVALAHGIPVCQPISLRKPEPQAELLQWQADVMIVAAYGLILPPAVLAIPRLGCINIHASLLPKWRGAAPIQRAILAGDTETGVTIMQMDAGLDTGAMLHKVTCPINPADTAHIIHKRLASMGASAILETLAAVQNHTAQPEQQDDSLASYARKIDKFEAEIDWQQDADYLDRFVRAFNPWPIAYTWLNDEPLRIWQAQAIDQPVLQAPGTLLKVDKHGIDVATAKGILCIQTIQLPGSRPLPIADILNAKKERFHVGQLFSRKP